LSVSFTLPAFDPHPPPVTSPFTSDPISVPGFTPIGETNTRIATFNYSLDRTTCCDTITPFLGTAQLLSSPSLQISNTFGAGLIFSTTTGNSFFLPGPGLPSAFSLSTGNSPSFVSINRTYSPQGGLSTQFALRADFIITDATAETTVPEPNTLLGAAASLLLLLYRKRR
ncbi:MAG: PEP-CTERM sorting domain-containing protein, partial [Bryobacterales bacterium]|nr:PEP-CTERM sorting domain-containing protein [Bryobacterales bacterium]